MFKHLKWFGLSALLAVPVAGFAAQDLSYNFVQLGYANVDFDDLDADADGFGVEVSGQIADHVYIFAGYATVETDDFSFMGATVSAEEDTISAGVGFRMPVQPTTDLTASLAFIDDEVKASGSGPGGSASFREDDTGFGLSVGLRHLFAPQFEGQAGISYVDLYDDDATGFSLGGLFHATPILSFGTSYTFGEDADIWIVGGRLNY